MTKKLLPLPVSALAPTISLNHVQTCMSNPYPETLTFIGQQRAQSALDFSLGMELPGYNVYVMGEAAHGRFTLVKDKLQAHSKGRPTPNEWLYVNNYDDHREPIAMFLQAGQSKQLADDIDSFIDEVLDTFPAAFDNPAYQRKKKKIDREFNDAYDAAITEVEVAALEQSVALIEEKSVVGFAPLVDGKQLSDAEFAALDDELREQFYEKIEKLEDALIEALIELPRWKRESSEKLRNLKKSTAELATKPLLKDLEHKYAAHIGVLRYLKDIRVEIIDAVLEWLDDEDESDENKEDFDRKGMLTDFFAPNILVEFKEGDAAPVVYEPNPTFGNIFGKIEYAASQGSLITSYRSIQPGALHRANGGYLIMDAEKVMANPLVWDGLKLSLKTHQIKNDLPYQDNAVGSSFTLRPQLIPLDVKIILLGSRDLYYTIGEYDEEFAELFRVLADFDYYLPSSDKLQYQFITKVIEYCQGTLKCTLTDEAMARLLKFSYRQAEHHNKLSARFADVLELVAEASFYTKQDNLTLIDAHHIDEAIEGKQYRTGQISENMLSDIKEGHTLIATDGQAVGKVNGLTVLHIGDTSFGTPARITATVYAGADGVIDVEREAELGKAIHSKGVMLLTGYLGNKYAQQFSLTLSANIAIEQSYGYIDGDSASLAELCALISAITSLPLSQSIALTGSINQHGDVQAIGGVNEKIEGFFKLCKMRGLTSGQGVIIPKSNQVNLVLDDEILAAVELGKFHIYAVETVDQALNVLMNMEAGDLRDGQYPENSVNGIALARLNDIADIVNGDSDEKEDEKEES
ncbi:ATP-dependent protease [Pseudoalteromonas porphyrae]|uniref:endopeptidase La n=2 Tax=Pseudoalteromonas TaxID=53246 RepID=A0A0N0LYZ9_9GAMM|nr:MULTISPECIES: AAA family ATPase [Pseudoalteromonas]KPH61709.1 ATP-dependent protease [Pseudoalteromonas porphyrae]KPH93413.1 ATP-dependent protease [Pseudoalteromonas porphyrae]NNG42407.1 AAA family ATPase [Pseudoalteromonas sp. NEC-BIFX-2020_002]